MCLHHVFSTNSSDIDRLYVPRSQGGRGLRSVADVIKVNLSKSWVIHGEIIRAIVTGSLCKEMVQF